MMRIRLLSVLVCFIFRSAPLSAQTDLLVQTPHLSEPERGSVAGGTFSQNAWGPAQLTRGTASIVLPLALPSERAAVQLSFLPSYSAAHGLSEWGMGWRAQLSIERDALAGDIDFGGKRFLSPWGRLQLGTDGFYYVDGLRSAVRLRKDAAGWTAWLPDGTEVVFGEAEATAQGVYAWHVTRATSIRRDVTAFTYEQNPSGRRFLTTVEYGAAGAPAAYRVTLRYEPLATTWTSYHAGEGRTLDRRVSRVRVSVAQASGTYAPRWHYDLTHDPNQHGPAFYLTQLQRTFAAGGLEPAATFAYDRAEAGWASSAYTPSPDLDALLAAEGPALIQPNRAAYTDVDEDGRTDLEFNLDHRLYRFGDDGWTTEAAPPLPAQNLETLCRPQPRPDNRPRRLVRMRPDAAEPHVVAARQGASQTAVMVCSRAGERLHQALVPGSWRLDDNTRVADLNRDGKPDLIHAWPGKYEVLENQSTAAGWSFRLRRMSTVTPSLTLTGFWVHDVNGDGLVDLVARTESNLTVWYGHGDFVFGEATPSGQRQGRTLRLRTRAGAAVSLGARHVTWLDANKDGLADVLVTGGNVSTLFVGTGIGFQEVYIAGLQLTPGRMSVPVTVDLSGSGNAEVVRTLNGKAYTLALHRASTGLLSEADDGKGSAIRFRYHRAPAVAGAGRRASLLESITQVSVGHTPLTSSASYENPYIHRTGRFVVGYRGVTWRTPTRVTVADFHYDDELTVPLRQREYDPRQVDLERFVDHRYLERTYRGVRWWRPEGRREGWVQGPNQLAVETLYERYDKERCPVQTKTTSARGTLSELTTLMPPLRAANAWHCLAAEVTRRGLHPDPGHDFEQAWRFDRNDRGQVTRVTRGRGTEAWVAQEVDYGPQHRVQSVGQPGRGTTAVTYDSASGLLTTLTSPDGVVRRVAARDPVSDAVKELLTDRGGAPYRQFFDYDALERLRSGWSNFGGSSSTLPREAYTYDYATATTPGRVTSRQLMDAAAGTYRVERAWLAGDDTPLAEGRKIPEGWRLSGLLRPLRDVASSERYQRALLLDSALPPTADALYAGAEVVGVDDADGWGRSNGKMEVVQGPRVSPTGPTTPAVQHTRATTRRVEARGVVSQTLEAGRYDEVWVHDAHGEPVAFTDAAGRTTRYVYDALGRLVAVNLPGGKRHTQRWDALGRVSRIERDEVGSVRFTYDPTSGLVAEKRHFGVGATTPERTTTFRYDAIGRVREETHRKGASETLTYLFGYDGAAASADQRGFLTSMEGPEVQKRWRYHPDQTLAEEEVSLGGWRGLSFEHRYTPGGERMATRRIVRNIAAAGAPPLEDVTTTTTFDAFGREASVTMGPYAIGYRYDAEGLLGALTLPDGGMVTLERDSLTRRASGMDHTTRLWNAGVAWSWDERGHIAAEAFRVGVITVPRAYAYDVRGFVAGSTEPGRNTGYEYGADGRIASLRDRLGTRAVTRRGPQTMVGNVRYVNDDLGRVIERGDLALTYGANGQLASAQKLGLTRSYRYDEQGARVFERHPNGAHRARYAGITLTDAAIIEPVTVGGLTVGAWVSGTWKPLATDRRGTLFVEPSGSRKLASPYGVRGSRPAYAEAIDYATKGSDAFLGTVRMGVRDYDPFRAEWWTPDPLFLEAPEECVESPVECNLRSYAMNDPVGLVDPQGLKAHQVGVQLSGVAVFGLRLEVGYAWAKADNGSRDSGFYSTISFAQETDLGWNLCVNYTNTPDAQSVIDLRGGGFSAGATASLPGSTGAGVHAAVSDTGMRSFGVSWGADVTASIVSFDINRTWTSVITSNEIGQALGTVKRAYQEGMQQLTEYDTWVVR